MPMPRSRRRHEDALVGVAHGLVGDDDLAGFRPLQPGEAAQRRGLAAAGGAEQRDQLAGPDADADAVDGIHHHVAGRDEGLAEIFDREHERVILYACTCGAIATAVDLRRRRAPRGRVRGGVIHGLTTRHPPPQPSPTRGEGADRVRGIVLLKLTNITYPRLRLGRGRFAAALHPQFEPAQAGDDHDQRNDLETPSAETAP